MKNMIKKYNSLWRYQNGRIQCEKILLSFGNQSKSSSYCSLFASRKSAFYSTENLSKSQLKKLKRKEWQLAQKKEQKEKILAKEKEQKEKILAKEIDLPFVSEFRPSIDDLGVYKQCKLRDLTQNEEKVSVRGWVTSIRRQGKKLLFMVIRDGSGLNNLQIMVNGDLCQTYEAQNLMVEASVEVWGTIRMDNRAPGGIELHSEYWEVIGKSEELPINEDSTTHQLIKQKHLAIRRKEFANTLRMRAHISQAFRDYYADYHYVEIDPPTIVQTEVEGGSTLFQMDYFGESAYLTQSSQLYLETVIPVFGDVYCMARSYRAESSSTPRHLAEFTHIEAERPFITFEDLLQTVEHTIRDVTKRVVEKHLPLLEDLNPNIHQTLKSIQDPFLRMTYHECIDYCNEHKIYQDEAKAGSPNQKFNYGDDITDKPEREMVAKLGRPVLMTHFPAEMKSFYMERCPKNSELTESVDVLLPGIGEVVGGSMRIWEHDKLLHAFQKEGLDANTYQWYLDMRKYGSVPHGGYGLGLERYVLWLCGSKHVRDTTLYPRYMNLATP